MADGLTVAGGVFLSYLDTVGERAGAFTVWPGSHRALYKASKEDINFVPTDDYEATVAEIKAKVRRHKATSHKPLGAHDAPRVLVTDGAWGLADATG